MIITFCKGKSMLPTFSKLVMIFVKQVPYAEYKVGDIILFEGYDKKKYCHRITSIINPMLTTKGDNESESHFYESYLLFEKVIGKVIKHVNF